ncbi:hypothetical protein PGAL8A_00277800 [Plasmodium gallinaceum]|uniref:Uncharacterized protein n=1 Tax=Plasmodium gallinaceum TaxID=5849 RepID=A0A1J1GW99_PLAGA|nr:hypothetical protein PGAL8A_00277800 [Plasmodium gallinaceum]CRG95581.1 hypothetical protein PGAL8A_00277800 [Plasmodium gallinaceum]
MKYFAIFFIIFFFSTVLTILYKRSLKIQRKFVKNNCIIYLCLTIKYFTIKEIVIDIEYKKKILINLKDVKIKFSKWCFQLKIFKLFVNCSYDETKKTILKEKDTSCNYLLNFFLFLLNVIEIYIEEFDFSIKKIVPINDEKICQREINEISFKSTKDYNNKKNFNHISDVRSTKYSDMFFTFLFQIKLSNVFVNFRRKNFSLLLDLSKFSFFCNNCIVLDISSSNLYIFYNYFMKTINVKIHFILKTYVYLNKLFELCFLLTKSKFYLKKSKSNKLICVNFKELFHNINIYVQIWKIYIKEEKLRYFLCFFLEEISIEKNKVSSLAFTKIKNSYLLSIENKEYFISNICDALIFLKIKSFDEKKKSREINYKKNNIHSYQKENNSSIVIRRNRFRNIKDKLKGNSNNKNIKRHNDYLIYDDLRNIKLENKKKGLIDERKKLTNKKNKKIENDEDNMKKLRFKLYINFDKVYLNVYSIYPLIFLKYMKKLVDIFNVKKNKKENFYLYLLDNIHLKDNPFGEIENFNKIIYSCNYNINSYYKRKIFKMDLNDNKEIEEYENIRNLIRKRKLICRLFISKIFCKFYYKENNDIKFYNFLNKKYVKSFELVSSSLNIYSKKNLLLFFLQNIKVLYFSQRPFIHVNHLKITKLFKDFFFEIDNMFFYFSPTALLTIRVVKYILEFLDYINNSNLLQRYFGKNKHNERNFFLTFSAIKAETNKLKVFSNNIKIIILKKYMNFVLKNNIIFSKNLKISCYYIDISDIKKDSNYIFILLQNLSCYLCFDKYFVEFFVDIDKIINFFKFIIHKCKIKFHKDNELSSKCNKKDFHRTSRNKRFNLKFSNIEVVEIIKALKKKNEKKKYISDVNIYKNKIYKNYKIVSDEEIINEHLKFSILKHCIYCNSMKTEIKKHEKNCENNDNYKSKYELNYLLLYKKIYLDKNEYTSLCRKKNNLNSTSSLFETNNFLKYKKKYKDKHNIFTKNTFTFSECDLLTYRKEKKIYQKKKDSKNYVDYLELEDNKIKSDTKYNYRNKTINKNIPIKNYQIKNKYLNNLSLQYKYGNNNCYFNETRIINKIYYMNNNLIHTECMNNISTIYNSNKENHSFLKKITKTMYLNKKNKKKKKIAFIKLLLVLERIEISHEKDLNIIIRNYFFFFFKKFIEFKLTNLLFLFEYIKRKNDYSFFLLNYLIIHFYKYIIFCLFNESLNVIIKKKMQKKISNIKLSLNKTKIILTNQDNQNVARYIYDKLQYYKKYGNKIIKTNNNMISEHKKILHSIFYVLCKNFKIRIENTFLETHFFFEYICAFTLSYKSFFISLHKKKDISVNSLIHHFLLSYGFFTNMNDNLNLDLIYKENMYIFKKIFKKLKIKDNINSIIQCKKNKLNELLYINLINIKIITLLKSFINVEVDNLNNNSHKNSKYIIFYKNEYNKKIERKISGEQKEEEVGKEKEIKYNERTIFINAYVVGSAKNESLINCNILPYQILFFFNLIKNLNSFLNELYFKLENLLYNTNYNERDNILNKNFDNIIIKKNELKIKNNNKLNIKFKLNITNLHLKFYILRLYLKNILVNNYEINKINEEKRSNSYDHIIYFMFFENFLLSFEHVITNINKIKENFIFANDIRNFLPSIFLNIYKHILPEYCMVEENVFKILHIYNIDILIKKEKKKFFSFNNVKMYINDKIIEILKIFFSKINNTFIFNEHNLKYVRHNYTHSNIVKQSVFYINNFEINIYKIVEIKNRKKKSFNKKKKKKFFLEDIFINEKNEKKKIEEINYIRIGNNEENKNKISNYIFEKKMQFLKKKIKKKKEKIESVENNEKPLSNGKNNIFLYMKILKNLKSETCNPFYCYNKFFYHPFYFLFYQRAYNCSYAEKYYNACKNISLTFDSCEDQLLLFFYKIIIKNNNDIGEKKISIFFKNISSYYISSIHIFNINKYNKEEKSVTRDKFSFIIRRNKNSLRESEYSNELLLQNLYEKQKHKQKKEKKKKKNKKKRKHKNSEDSTGKKIKQFYGKNFEEDFNKSSYSKLDEKKYYSNEYYYKNNECEIVESNEIHNEFVNSNNRSRLGINKSFDEINEIKKKMKLFFCLPNKYDILSPFLYTKGFNIVIKNDNKCLSNLNKNITNIFLYFDFTIILFNKKVLDYFYYLSKKIIHFSLKKSEQIEKTNCKNVNKNVTLSSVHNYIYSIFVQNNFNSNININEFKNFYYFHFVMDKIIIEFIKRDYTNYIISLYHMYFLLKKKSKYILELNINDFSLEKIKNLKHSLIISSDKNDDSIIPNWILSFYEKLDIKKTSNFSFNQENDMNLCKNFLSLKLKFFKIFFSQNWNIIEKLNLSICNINLNIDKCTMNDLCLLKRFILRKQKEKKKRKKKKKKFSKYFYIHFLEISSILVKATIYGLHEMNFKLNINQFKEEKKLTYLKKLLKKYKKHVLKYVGSVLITRKFLDLIKKAKTNSQKLKNNIKEK